MQIHLMGSPFGNQKQYAKIASLLESEGHLLVTRHHIERKKEELEKESPTEAELFCKRVDTWISAADLVIFEVTTPCVEVGYDLASALNKGKAVLVLYKSDVGVVPYGLKGLQHEKLQVYSYTDENLTEVLGQALDLASQQANVRFSFPLTDEQAAFLDQAAQKQQLSRSAFLQQLLEREKARSRG